MASGLAKKIADWLLVASIMLCGTRCSAVVARSYDCHRASGEIKIDGKPDESVWNKADVITSFYVPVTGAKPLNKTEARMLWDDNYLYVAYRAYDKDIWSTFSEHDAATCQEDCLECFIQPSLGKQTYFNFEINALGTVYDAYNMSKFSGGFDHHRWAAWNCMGIQAGVNIEGTPNNPQDIDSYWQMEIAIPFAELVSVKQPKAGDVWRFLAARCEYSIYVPGGVELTSCVPLSKVDFHLPEEWSTLRFQDE